MKYSYEIVASYSGTINTGQYQNESPFFSAKMIVESDDEVDVSLIQKDLVLVCRQNWQDEFDRVNSVTSDKDKSDEVLSRHDTRKKMITEQIMEMASSDKDKAKEIYESVSDIALNDLGTRKIISVLHEVAKLHRVWYLELPMGEKMKRGTR